MTPPILPEMITGQMDGIFQPPPEMVDPNGMLSEEGRAAIKNLYARRVRPRIDVERTRENAKARKADLYWNGKQFLTEIYDGGAVVGYRTLEEDVRYQGRSDSPFIRDYVVNRYRDKGRKFCSVLGGKAPSLKALALREDDDKSTQLAKRCDLLALDFHRRWDRDSKHLDLSFFLFKYGTTWIYTPYVTDGRKYGQSRVQEVEESQQSIIGPDGQPTMESVQNVKEKTFDNGYVECHIIPGTMAFTAPGIRDIDRAPYFVYEYEEYAAVLLEDHPDWEETILDEMQGAPSGIADADGRRLRSLIASPTDLENYEANDQITVTHLWLAPGLLRMIEDDDAKKYFTSNFPRGAKVTFLNDKPVAVIEEFLGDVWTPVKPEVSDTLNCDGIGYDFLQIQDIINDGANQLLEILERLASIIIADPNVLNIDSITNSPAMPGQIISATPGSGPLLKGGITEIKGPDFDPNIAGFVDSIEGWGSEIIGITEQIYGGGEGVQTAEEARIRATQALRQLGITWKNMRTGWAQAEWKAVQQFARYHPDAIRIAGELIDPEELIDAEIVFEAQESMPQSFGEIREAIREVVQMGPDIWPLFNLDDVDNASVLDQYLGLPNWKWKGVNEINAVKAIISQLKESEPTQDPMTGAPAPSIPVDFRVMDPGLVVGVVRGWAVSPMGLSVKEANQGGYENVVALMESANQYIAQQQQMQAMQQMGGPPPPDGGGGPPPPQGPPPPPPQDGMGPVPMAPPVDPFAADPNSMPMPPEMLTDQSLPPGGMGEPLLR